MSSMSFLLVSELPIVMVSSSQEEMAMAAIATPAMYVSLFIPEKMCSLINVTFCLFCIVRTNLIVEVLIIVGKVFVVAQQGHILVGCVFEEAFVHSF